MLVVLLTNEHQRGHRTGDSTLHIAHKNIQTILFKFSHLPKANDKLIMPPHRETSLCGPNIRK